MNWTEGGFNELSGRVYKLNYVEGKRQPDQVTGEMDVWLQKKVIDRFREGDGIIHR